MGVGLGGMCWRGMGRRSWRVLRERRGGFGGGAGVGDVVGVLGRGGVMEGVVR